MRPGEGDADDRDRENHRRDEVSERKPPAGQDEPDQVADQAKRAGADIGLAGQFVATHRPEPNGSKV